MPGFKAENLCWEMVCRTLQDPIEFLVKLDF
jgi:hypothetical protein